MNNDAFVKNVASRLIEQIRNGTAPWQKPWRPGTSFLPFNPTNGTRYKGINVVNLLARGHSDARWMTYRQAKLRAIRFAGAKKARRCNTGALMRSAKSRIPMVVLLLTLMESRARKRSAENARKCLSHMCSTPNRLREFRRRRLVSVPGTRLKRLNSLFKQQIPNFSMLPVIVRFTGRQRIPSICL